jgi:ribosome-binding protein aMBF1 (putative translation factor)
MKKKKQQVKSPEKSKLKPEQLSRKDIEELMGVNMQTYSRRHGAIRNSSKNRI